MLFAIGIHSENDLITWSGEPFQSLGEESQDREVALQSLLQQSVMKLKDIEQILIVDCKGECVVDCFEPRHIRTEEQINNS